MKDTVTNLNKSDQNALYELGQTYSDNDGNIFQYVKIAFANVYRKRAAIYIDTDFLVNPGRGFIVNGVMNIDVDTTDLTAGYKYLWVLKSGANIKVELNATDVGSATAYDKEPLVPRAILAANYIDGQMMAQGNAFTFPGGQIDIAITTGAVAGNPAGDLNLDDYVKPGDLISCNSFYTKVTSVASGSVMTILGGTNVVATNAAFTISRENPVSVANMIMTADGNVTAEAVVMPNTLTITADASNAESTIGGNDATKVLKIGDIISGNGENRAVLSITNATFATMNAAWTTALTTASAIKAYTHYVPCVIKG